MAHRYARRRGGVVCFTLALVVVSGCATVRPDARFPAVQEATASRLGQRLVWDHSGGEAEAVRTTVAALLSQPLAADHAVQIALLNSNALQAVFEDLGLIRNPSLAGFFRFPDRPPFGVNWNVGVDFWPLDALLIPLRKRLAGAALEAAERRVSRSVLDLAAQTRVAFYTLWAAEQTLATQRSVAELAGRRA